MNGPSPASRILVADDSETNRYVLSTWLRRADYEVVEAATGYAALALAEAQRLDLVVLDVNLPDASGYEICERIKTMPHTAAVPVLQVSATSIAVADRAEALRRGADVFLIEPIEREEFLASVAALLRFAAAQRVARELAWRLRSLNDATLAINDAPSLDRLVSAICEQGALLFEATAYVVVAMGDRALRAVVPAQGAAATIAPMSIAAADGLRRTFAEHPARFAALLRDGEERAAGVRFFGAEIAAAGVVRGLLVIEAHESPDELVAGTSHLVLTQFVRAAGVALRNVQSFDTERQIALTLQRSLLPGTLPVLAGLDVAVRYEAGAEHAEVGGDFYEVFALDEDVVAIAIGDVVGHSLEAATVMAELRSGVRAYMLEGHSPAATIERLNRFLLRFHLGLTATVCCATFDRRTRILSIANAGHPPPLVIGRDGASFLPLGGTLLGVHGVAAETQQVTLDDGDVLLLYTDGLVERPRQSVDEGMAWLARLAAEPSPGIEALCDRLVSEGASGRVDDIAIVAMRAHGASAGVTA